MNSVHNDRYGLFMMSVIFDGPACRHHKKYMLRLALVFNVSYFLRFYVIITSTTIILTTLQNMDIRL